MAGAESALEEQIKAQVGEWSTNSTEAFHISLYQSDKLIHTFHPDFTYPIFGDEEAIFGYQGLKISLAFAAHNMLPHLNISHEQRYPDQGEVKATDVKAVLEDFLPSSAFSKQTRAAALADSYASKFRPPGTKIHGYKSNGKSYEIWCGPLSDHIALQIYQNMQILVPMFIEGGTLLELDQAWIVERWKLFLLYEVATDAPASASSYSLAGFSTSYRVTTFPDRQEELAPTPMSEADFDKLIAESYHGHSNGTVGHAAKSALNLPSRERISQFLILPPYQGAGHGAHLYNTVYQLLISAPNVIELTVEDPNEAFDDLRDVCDLLNLRSTDPDFASLKITTAIDPSLLKPSEHIPVDHIVSGDLKERIRQTSKIMPRQLGRLIEMQTLSKIPRPNRNPSRITRKEKSSNENDRAFYFWRLYVKQRVYIQNRDALVQVDREERIERLEGVLEGVVDDYARLLELAEKRAGIVAREANGVGDGGRFKSSGKRGKKRRLVVEDDDEDDDDVDVDEEVSNAGAKRKVKTAKRAAVTVDDEDSDEGEDIGDAFDD